MQTAIIATLTILVGINVFVSAMVWRSGLFTRSQKLMQSCVIWLIPILGPALTWSVLRGAETERLTTDLADRRGSPVADGEDIRLDTDAADVGGFGHDGGGH